MLKITKRETAEELVINLEGRVAGPWAAELSSFWMEMAPQRKTRAVVVDLRDVTYMDEEGKMVLREIESQTGAELIATTPWTRHLVAEILETKTNA
jgi:anti-anti-sigma factor